VEVFGIGNIGVLHCFLKTRPCALRITGTVSRHSRSVALSGCVFPAVGFFRLDSKDRYYDLETLKATHPSVMVEGHQPQAAAAYFAP
jgi:hypothetical protein